MIKNSSPKKWATSILCLALISGLIYSNYSMGEGGSEMDSKVYGEFFKPTQKQFDQAIIDSQMADWESLPVIKPLDIKTIEFIGFKQRNNGKTVHFRTTKPEHLKIVSAGLDPYSMRRFALSDFTTSLGGIGGDSRAGVIIVHTPKKEFVIGITGFGFQLGTSQQSELAAFESWLLAKAVDDIFAEELETHLPEEMFEKLSGMAWINSSKKYYEKLTNPKKEE